MTRALIVVRHDGDRKRAADWSMKAPSGCRIEFKATKRTLSQNARLWAMLGELAHQLDWHGMKLRPQDWKVLFVDALKRELRAVPNLDNTGFVSLGRSSTDLSKEEFSGLMELVAEFGARHGVTFADEREPA